MDIDLGVYYTLRPILMKQDYPRDEYHELSVMDTEPKFVLWPAELCDTSPDPQGKSIP